LQEPESYESWGNIGAVYMGQNNLEGALHAFQVLDLTRCPACAHHSCSGALVARARSWQMRLFAANTHSLRGRRITTNAMLVLMLMLMQEAIKLRVDNWKMWQNTLTAALGLRRISVVIQAMNHLMSLKVFVSVCVFACCSRNQLSWLRVQWSEFLAENPCCARLPEYMVSVYDCREFQNWQDKEVDVPVLAMLVDEALRCLEAKKLGQAKHSDETLIAQVILWCGGYAFTMGRCCVAITRVWAPPALTVRNSSAVLGHVHLHVFSLELASFWSQTHASILGYTRIIWAGGTADEGCEHARCR
jgi:hypothetical protein